MDDCDYMDLYFYNFDWVDSEKWGKKNKKKEIKINNTEKKKPTNNNISRTCVKNIS